VWLIEQSDSDARWLPALQKTAATRLASRSQYLLPARVAVAQALRRNPENGGEALQLVGLGLDTTALDGGQPIARDRRTLRDFGLQ
jgi:hypothetical protein